MALERLAIVGTGLMGACVGLAAKRAGVAEVAGFDTDPASSAAALVRRAIDRASPTLEDAVAEAELVVVAVPVSRLLAVVAASLEASTDDCTVTDVGSTKAGVCSGLSSSRFVGGHPLGGSEAQGAEHASADLLRGVTWFLTPTSTTDPSRVDDVRRFVAGLGAKPAEVDPEVHDRLLVLTSQLPHALANLLLNQVAGADVDGHDPLAAAGRSFRELTRVAGANRDVWLDVFLDRADLLARALAEHRARVEGLEAALLAGDRELLGRWIDEAAGHRRRLLGED